MKKFLGCMDPRQKHEYLESGQSLKITEGERNGDESD